MIEARTPDLLRWASRRTPDRPCVIADDRVLTFAEVDHRANRLASALQDAGIERGDRVALLAMNEPEFFEVQTAVMRMGAILVPLNYRLTVPELRYIIEDSEPQLLVHGPGLAGSAAELQVPDRWYLGTDGSGDPYEERIAAHAPPPGPATVPAEDPCLIMYTSGTTGRPKGAVTSNRAFSARIETFAFVGDVPVGATFVQPLPMFHSSSGLSYTFTYRGGTNVLIREFSADGLLDAIERHSASHVLLVPTMINTICGVPDISERDLSSLGLVMYGASPIAPALLRRAIDVFGAAFWQGYGMTETGSITALGPEDHDPERFPERLSSCGREAIGAPVRVVDERGREVDAGVVGEISVSGPALLSGYWKDPDETAAAMDGDWFLTGDAGYRDEDGYLFITDRVHDMIVTGGENVYPREVEDVLYEHPGVIEAAVVGVPDERWGEAVHAAVVLRDPPPDAKELRDHCRASLAGYKVPKTIEILDELPKSSTGKILRRLVRDGFPSPG